MGDAANDGVDRANDGADKMAAGRLQCPFCNSYDVARMFVASLGLDSCECVSCSAGWDEERSSGRYRGRSESTSILMRASS
ncbi:MAG: hypothetical protein ACR2KK_19610 [Acidimicrobiales bacterium]